MTADKLTAEETLDMTELEICSCEEALYLREFAKRVLDIATSENTSWADMAEMFQEMEIDKYFQRVQQVQDDPDSNC